MKFWILFTLGLIIIAFMHLIIPICVAKSKKPYSKKILWLIAIGSGVLGYIMITVVFPTFDFLSGAVLSGIFTVIAYFILKKYCSEKKE